MKISNKIIIFICLILTSCILVPDKKDVYLSYFPTDADISGLKRFSPPKIVNDENIITNIIPININEKELFYSKYEHVSEDNWEIDLYIAKFSNEYDAYNSIHNEQTQNYKIYKNKIIHYKNNFRFRVGVFAVTLYFNFESDQIYNFFNMFHIFLIKNLPSESTNIRILNDDNKFTKIIFEQTKNQYFLNGFYQYKFNFNESSYFIEFVIINSIYETERFYYNILRNNPDFIVNNTEDYNSSFYKDNDSYIYAGSFENIVYIIRGVEKISIGKELVRALYDDFQEK